MSTPKLSDDALCWVCLVGGRGNSDRCQSCHNCSEFTPDPGRELRPADRPVSVSDARNLSTNGRLALLLYLSQRVLAEGGD